MRLELDVSLDPTLGCGQAHRWRRDGDVWEGIVGGDVVRMRQTDYGAEVEGCSDPAALRRYFRSEDDLAAIVAEISGRDPYVASLSAHCPGLRILKQDEWECLATYLLATNANVARIGRMVESVCETFGRDLGGRHAFPTPGEILDGADRIGCCRLGFREPRLIKLAHDVEEGTVDPAGIGELDYGGCVAELRRIDGVGPKVADCVAIFGYGHLEAFPVDVRISKVMESMYGVAGSYAKVSAYGRERFGRYAGYAQELLYHSRFIARPRTGSISEGRPRSAACISPPGTRWTSRPCTGGTSRSRSPRCLRTCGRRTPRPPCGRPDRTGTRSTPRRASW